MKKYYKLTMLAAAALCAGLSSCGESNDEQPEYPNWKETNEKFFSQKFSEARSQQAGGDNTVKVLRSWSLNEVVAQNSYNYVVVNVLNSGTGSGCPLYTDSVMVNVRARLLPSTSYPDGYVFLQSYSGDFNPDLNAPVKMSVAQSSAVTNGLSTALQQMHIGDRWKVWVPYQLGYGTTSTTSPTVEAYSTLIYDVELVAYFRADAPKYSLLPSGAAKAKPSAAGHWIYE